MAGKRSAKAEEKLDKDVERVLSTVKKKGSLQSGEIQKLLGVATKTTKKGKGVKTAKPQDSGVKSYRYRTVLAEALKRGLQKVGQGPATLYSLKQTG